MQHLSHDFSVGFPLRQHHLTWIFTFLDTANNKLLYYQQKHWSHSVIQSQIRTVQCPIRHIIGDFGVDPTSQSLDWCTTSTLLNQSPD